MAGHCHRFICQGATRLSNALLHRRYPSSAHARGGGAGSSRVLTLVRIVDAGSIVDARSIVCLPFVHASSIVRFLWYGPPEYLASNAKQGALSLARASAHERGSSNTGWGRVQTAVQELRGKGGGILSLHLHPDQQVSELSLRSCPHAPALRYAHAQGVMKASLAHLWLLPSRA